ncbi:MAG: hypothetical protein FD129_415, partial [bacterium]
MRIPILALTAAAFLLAAPLMTAPIHAAPSQAADTKMEPKKKEPPADVGAGRIAWFDLATTDLAKSRDFYIKLFDWEFTAVAFTDMALEIVASDKPIGTLRLADGAVSPFNGVVYVQVDDVEVTCAKATELGGTVAPYFPFDLPDGIGAIGLLTDPGGA